MSVYGYSTYAFLNLLLHSGLIHMHSEKFLGREALAKEEES